MARYIARSKTIKYAAELAFDEWVSARRYAHGLLKGTVVEITDTAAEAGRPSAYIVTAGRAGLVRIHPRHRTEVRRIDLVLKGIEEHLEDPASSPI